MKCGEPEAPDLPPQSSSLRRLVWVERKRRIGLGPEPLRLAPQSIQQLIHPSLRPLQLISRYFEFHPPRVTDMHGCTTRSRKIQATIILTLAIPKTGSMQAAFNLASSNLTRA